MMRGGGTMLPPSRIRSKNPLGSRRLLQ